MKEKTSVSLSREVLNQIDRLAGRKRSRSAFIEQVLREYLRRRNLAARDARDRKLINEAADELNREAAEARDLAIPIDFSAEPEP
jgi:metal-responsive CopG/Arc/MetJ family transcriptional regulator